MAFYAQSLLYLMLWQNFVLLESETVPPKCDDNFRQENYLYPYKLSICDGDDNFVSNIQQQVVIRRLIQDSARISQETAISVPGCKNIVTMPELRAFKMKILPKDSPLCDRIVDFDVEATYKAISKISDKSIVNAFIFPHEMKIYYESLGRNRSLYGFADYGGAYLDSIQKFRFGRRIDNFIAIASSVYKKYGYDSFLELFMHEIGHTFELESIIHGKHDPDDALLESDIEQNGTFIMTGLVTNVHGINNLKYSPATRWMFGKYVQTVFNMLPYSWNITIPVREACGNGIFNPEYNEECECIPNIPETAKLCDCEKCKLKTNVQCIPTIHECCSTNGMVASNGTECRPNEIRLCNKPAICDGTSVHCPAQKRHTNGEHCADGHVCSKDGFCIAEKCPTETIACHLNGNCISGCLTNFVCVPRFFRPNGEPCMIKFDMPGICFDGQCRSKNPVQDDDGVVTSIDTKLRIIIPFTLRIAVIAAAIITIIIIVVCKQYFAYIRKVLCCISQNKKTPSTSCTNLNNEYSGLSQKEDYRDYM